ncbi:MAG: hypothetical protein U1A78_37290 [Polyangia bacterium]
MTFLRHIAKTSRFHAAASRTLGGQGGLAAREEGRFTVAQRPIARAAALPGENTPRSYLYGDPWQGSGPS